MPTKKKTAKKKVRRPKAAARKKGAGRKKGKAATAPRRNLLDAAAEVLATAKNPMSCREIVGAVLEAGTWTTTGKTPVATLSSAIHRELQSRGQETPFRKTERGRFALVKKG